MDLRPRDVLSPANLALLALAVAAAVLSFLALSRTASPPEATSTLSPATAAPTPSPSPSPEGPKTVAFLGDEVSAAVGAPGQGFADLLAAERGWNLQNFSVPDSGYLAGQPFSDRLPAVVAADPDVVMLQGGANDAELGDVAAAATALIEQLRASLPETRIALVSPVFTGEGEPGPEFQAVRDALRQVAATSRVHFLDTFDAFAGPPPTVDGELTAEAHATLASALLDDLELLKI